MPSHRRALGAPNVRVFAGTSDAATTRRACTPPRASAPPATRSSSPTSLVRTGGTATSMSLASSSSPARRSHIREGVDLHRRERRLTSSVFSPQAVTNGMVISFCWSPDSERGSALAVASARAGEIPAQRRPTARRGAGSARGGARSIRAPGRCWGESTVPLHRSGRTRVAPWLLPVPGDRPPTRQVTLHPCDIMAPGSGAQAPGHQGMQQGPHTDLQVLESIRSRSCSPRSPACPLRTCAVSVRVESHCERPEATVQSERDSCARPVRQGTGWGERLPSLSGAAARPEFDRDLGGDGEGDRAPTGDHAADHIGVDQAGVGRHDVGSQGGADAEADGHASHPPPRPWRRRTTIVVEPATTRPSTEIGRSRASRRSSAWRAESSMWV